jgi:hypothetical protein
MNRADLVVAEIVLWAALLAAAVRVQPALRGWHS